MTVASRPCWIDRYRRAGFVAPSEGSNGRLQPSSVNEQYVLLCGKRFGHQCHVESIGLGVSMLLNCKALLFTIFATSLDSRNHMGSIDLDMGNSIAPSYSSNGSSQASVVKTSWPRATVRFCNRAKSIEFFLKLEMLHWAPTPTNPQTCPRPPTNLTPDACV